MLKALTLKNKIKFLTYSVLVTSSFIYWVAVAYQWEQERLGLREDDSPEAYYP